MKIFGLLIVLRVCGVWGSEFLGLSDMPCPEVYGQNAANYQSQKAMVLLGGAADKGEVLESYGDISPSLPVAEFYKGGLPHFDGWGDSDGGPDFDLESLSSASQSYLDLNIGSPKSQKIDTKDDSYAASNSAVISAEESYLEVDEVALSLSGSVLQNQPTASLPGQKPKARRRKLHPERLCLFSPGVSRWFN
jgi:hypothetical protein